MVCTDKFGCQLHGFRPVLVVRYAQPDHSLLLQQQRNDEPKLASVRVLKIVWLLNQRASVRILKIVWLLGKRELYFFVVEHIYGIACMANQSKEQNRRLWLLDIASPAADRFTCRKWWWARARKKLWWWLRSYADRLYMFCTAGASATRNENGWDMNAYRWYYICFHISVQIWIRIRIVSTRIGYDWTFTL